MSSNYARHQLMNIATASTWTRDLRHVTTSIPRFWAQRGVVFSDPRFKSSKPKDRIKWWNIVPGDQIRLLGDPEGTIHEVQRVNKLTNRVLVKAQSNSEDTENPRMQNNKSYPYSRCQLLIGKREFPPLPGETKPNVLPVFAKRITMTQPKWYGSSGRYDWKRFAAATVPQLPGWSPKEKEIIEIPWPEVRRRKDAPATIYDTSIDSVLEITYKPPTIPSSFKAPLPRPPSEHQYIRSLTKGLGFDASIPMEVHLQKEVSNPHSRAKKQARWQALQQHQSDLLKTFVKAEFKNLNGRTRRVARAEAVWKWKQKLAEERKAEVKRRWENRGQQAKLQGKLVRRARKNARIEKKLQELVLQEEPNQVVPGSQPAL
ncbi:hypothetical protein ABKN59_000165 [Abortiporus biennis]